MASPAANTKAHTTGMKQTRGGIENYSSQEISS